VDKLWRFVHAGNRSVHGLTKCKVLEQAAIRHEMVEKMEELIFLGAGVTIWYEMSRGEAEAVFRSWAPLVRRL
jgi:hypothetical protein